MCRIYKINGIVKICLALMFCVILMLVAAAIPGYAADKTKDSPVIVKSFWSYGQPELSAAGELVFAPAADCTPVVMRDMINTTANGAAKTAKHSASV